MVIFKLLMKNNEIKINPEMVMNIKKFLKEITNTESNKIGTIATTFMFGKTFDCIKKRGQFGLFPIVTIVVSILYFSKKFFS